MKVGGVEDWIQCKCRHQGVRKAFEEELDGGHVASLWREKESKEPSGLE